MGFRVDRHLDEEPHAFPVQNLISGFRFRGLGSGFWVSEFRLSGFDFHVLRFTIRFPVSGFKLRVSGFAVSSFSRGFRGAGLAPGRGLRGGCPRRCRSGGSSPRRRASTRTSSAFGSRVSGNGFRVSGSGFVSPRRVKGVYPPPPITRHPSPRGKGERRCET